MYELHRARAPTRGDECIRVFALREVADPAHGHRGGGRRGGEHSWNEKQFQFKLSLGPSPLSGCRPKSKSLAAYAAYRNPQSVCSARRESLNVSK